MPRSSRNAWSLLKTPPSAVVNIRRRNAIAVFKVGVAVVFDVVDVVSEPMNAWCEKAKSTKKPDTRSGFFVPMAGVEPACLATHASETCVSTNFTTSAVV